MVCRSCQLLFLGVFGMLGVFAGVEGAVRSLTTPPYLSPLLRRHMQVLQEPAAAEEYEDGEEEDVDLEPEHQPGPDYQYGFQVHDAHTSNFQQRQESRDKGVIRGFYSLLEPDGSLRLVTYTADESGFRALVARQPAASSAGGPSGPVSATAHT